MENKSLRIFFIFLFFLLIFAFPRDILAKNFLEKSRDFFNLVQEVNDKDFQKRQKALEKSSNIKGIYLTQYTGGSSSSWAKNKRKEIKQLLRETELNGVVIDVKEVTGQTFTDSLKEFIDELHKDGFWVIARIVVCRDSSMINIKPEWYLKNSSGSLWQDKAGYFWLDPACPEVQNYILEVSQKAVDFDFDEIQFDYLRFPDRGALEGIVYPCHNKESKKRQAINDFYSALSEDLRNYKKDIILSVDLFGLVAQYFNISETGQNASDTLGKFDYISFMLYPSHFFNGFVVQKDLKRNLPALYFSSPSNHPYEVVHRTVLNASDYISSFYSKPEGRFQYKKSQSFLFFLNYLFSEYNIFLEENKKNKSRIRPWLQDFDLKKDSQQGICYDAEKVRAQIKASEDAGASGWLLWNPWNVYTKEALNPY